MTPAQKRAAGKGVVGYVRVSAAGQTDGWSLGNQEQVIRSWAAEHALPVIAIEQAPDGHESGATAFDDRVGWQAVERHIASGRVGWVAVAAIDRLSRDLAALADQVRQWQDQDIAIVAPAQGYDQLDGIGTFMLHIWGTLADHERKRLLARVLPGMQARLRSGLPLGTQPLGYRVVTDAPVAGQRPRRHLEPDPATAPLVQAIFAQALAEPGWGARRLAAWAANACPGVAWSAGGIARMLANPVYAGVLIGRLRGEIVYVLNNHIPLIDPTTFAAVRRAAKQRAADHDAGLNAATAVSWLGGIATCWRCGGVVHWRSTADGGGMYVCTGGAPAGPAGSPRGACGATWSIGIEAFVWRAVERLLEADVATLHRLAGAAVERLPICLDERHRAAADSLAAADAEEEAATDALATGALDPDAYAAACTARDQRRAEARALLDTVDGWTYLARLIAVQEGPAAGPWRWLPLQEALLRLPMDERRRLLRRVGERVVLQDQTTIGLLDGPIEDPATGRFPGVTITTPVATAAADSLAPALARMLVHSPGWDVDRGLRECGWVRRDSADGVRWMATDASAEVRIAEEQDATRPP